MKWILISWVLAGDNYLMNKIEFNSEQNCKAASEWLNKKSKVRFNKTYRPVAKCFKI